MALMTVAVLIPCPKCGHNNRPHRRVKESIRMWATDTLPLCKQCGYQLQKHDYAPPKGTPYLKTIKAEQGGD